MAKYKTFYGSEQDRIEHDGDVGDFLEKLDLIIKVSNKI
jgi:hypothetical protein